MKTDNQLQEECYKNLCSSVNDHIWNCVFEHLSLDARECIDISVKVQLYHMECRVERIIWDRVRSDVCHQLQIKRPSFTEYLYLNV